MAFRKQGDAQVLGVLDALDLGPKPEPVQPQRKLLTAAEVLPDGTKRELNAEELAQFQLALNKFDASK